jgi:rhodanese-related sulfurtransferase
MNKNIRRTAVLIFFFHFIGLIPSYTIASQTTEDISGRIIGGYRVLPVEKPTEGNNLALTVYRGDYIKFSIGDSIDHTIFSLPSLSINEKLPRHPKNAPFFKMKKTGEFPFTLGGLNGTITVVEFQKPNYTEVSSNGAHELLQKSKPLVLDVRTESEYKKGHLENAVLIPVQQLQTRLNELLSYKDQDILVYCATGNRSTVASKIMLDSGFTRIHNMRYGIYQWSRDNYPVVR